MIFDDWQNNNTKKFSSSLLWEYNLENFDWDYMQEIVVQRVIERGWMKDYVDIA